MAQKETFIASILEIEALYSEFPKSLRIRIERWVEKLVNSGSNPAFTTHRNAYTKLLLSMVRQSRFSEPFHRMPPDGRLAPFPTHLKSKLRPVEAPAAYEAVSNDGFWGDMRARAEDNGKNGSSTAGTRNSASLYSAYNHNLPVAHNTEEAAHENLERAHSNAISHAPPKKSTSPAVSPHRAAAGMNQSTRPSYDSHATSVTLPAFQPLVTRSLSPPPPPPISHGNRNDNVTAAATTPIRVTTRPRDGGDSMHAHEIHHAYHQYAWGADPHSHGSPDGGRAKPATSTHQYDRVSHPSQNHHHHNKKVTTTLEEKHYVADTRELPNDISLLHSLIKEQNIRIQIVEEALSEERLQHTLDLQHMEFKYLTELTRLREVEVRANKEKEDRDRRELELMSDQHVRSFSFARQNSYNSALSALNNSISRDTDDRGGPGGNANSSTNDDSNLEYGREYNSVEFDRAYGRTSNDEKGITSGTIGTVKGAEKPLYPGSPYRAPKNISDKHHLIHISSPPPRMPGKPTSPILDDINAVSAAQQSQFHRTTSSSGFREAPPVIPFPSASMVTQRWVGDSNIGVGNSADFARLDFSQATQAQTQWQQSRRNRNSKVDSVLPSYLRESTDADDEEFLSYLSSFQDELLKPV